MASAEMMITNWMHYFINLDGVISFRHQIIGSIYSCLVWQFSAIKLMSDKKPNNCVLAPLNGFTPLGGWLADCYSWS